jgi:hypothetical protein
MRPHLVRLLADPNTVLGELQRNFHSANCPATAAATHLYLRTGQTRRAPSSLTGGFICSDPTRSGRRIVPFLASVSHGRVENCAVIGAFGSNDREHYFNLVKLTRGTFYVDAFTRPPVFATDVVARTQWANRFEFFRDFVCRPAQ